MVLALSVGYSGDVTRWNSILFAHRRVSEATLCVGSGDTSNVRYKIVPQVSVGQMYKSEDVELVVATAPSPDFVFRDVDRHSVRIIVRQTGPTILVRESCEQLPHGSITVQAH